MDLLGYIDNITEIYDEPQADTTSIPIYFISKLAKEQGIKVVLNGDGPDELFAGYRNYLKYIELEPYYSLSSRLPTAVKKIIKKAFGLVNSEGSPLYEILHRMEKQQDLFWPGAGGIKEGVKNQVLSKTFIDRMKNHESYKYVCQLKKEFLAFTNTNKSEDYINWLCYSGYRHANIERFLFRSDRIGMANSIESRSPFLNYEFVELALSIPSIYKIKNRTPKYILKKALERILPNEILYRQKMGFCLPIREWASETICSFVNTNIDSFCRDTGLFNPNAIKHKTKLLEQGKKELTNTIWTFYFLIHWYKKWM